MTRYTVLTRHNGTITRALYDLPDRETALRVEQQTVWAIAANKRRTRPHWSDRWTVETYLYNRPDERSVYLGYHSL